MQKRNNLLIFAMCVVLLMTACQDNEDYHRFSSSLNTAAVDNKAAQAFLLLTHEQENAYEKIKNVLGTNTPRFDLMQTGSTSEFGPYFLFPYVNGENVISGSIIVPMDEEQADMSARKLMGSIGTPIDMNSVYLNERISKFSRFIYSYNFKKWEDDGEKVVSALSQYARAIDENKVKVTREEVIAQTSHVLQGKSRAYSLFDRVGDLRITFNLEYYKAPARTDEVEVVALSSKTLEDIFQESFRYNEYATSMRFYRLSKGYRLMTVQFLIMSEDFYAKYPMEFKVNHILERVRQKVYEKGFNITFQYTYSYPPQSVAFPATGSGSGGSGTGGSPTGSNPSKPKKNDEKNFVDDCSSPKVQYKEAVNALVDSMRVANTQDSDKHGITLDEYLQKVKDAKIEYSTTLDKYPGLDINSRPTIKHELKDMVEGTENKVDNFVGKHTVAELHNHPNGTPPSFQDVLYTAKQAADKTIIGYKATFVYNAKDDSFYALYVHDRDKAARFYDEIKDQIDSETMMFKDKSQIQTILEDY